MNDNDRDVFRGLRPTTPPASLRARTLEGARQTKASPVRSSPWETVIGSTVVRLAWAASVVALLGAHVWLSFSPSAASGSRPSHSSPSLTMYQADPGLEETIALPQIDPGATPGAGWDVREPRTEEPTSGSEAVNRTGGLS